MDSVNTLVGGFDAGTRGDFSIFCDYHNPISHKIKVAIDVFFAWKWSDDNIVANPHVLIQNGTLNMAIFANANRNWPPFFLRSIIICTHQDAIFDHGPFRDLTTNANDRMGDLCLADAAALC